MYTVLCRAAYYVLENGIGVYEDKSSIWEISVEFIGKGLELAIEDLVCRVYLLYASSAIRAILSQFTWTATYLTNSKQHNLPCSIIVQNLYKQHRQH